MVISWYSCDCLEDDECIQPLVKMCIRLWPCLAFNFDTQSRFMKMLLFLSDDSLPGILGVTFYWENFHMFFFFCFLIIYSFLLVCKSMASISLSIIGNSRQNLMHAIIDYCVNETNKAKNPRANLTILELGLRIVSNCCSCVEGRLLINKVTMQQH